MRTIVSNFLLALFLGGLVPAGIARAQTYYCTASGLGLSVTDDGYNGTLGSMRSVNLTVSDSFTLTDVNLTVGMVHSWIGDLVIKIRSPAMTIVTVMSRPGLAERRRHRG